MTKDDSTALYKIVFELLPEAIFLVDKLNFKIQLCNSESQHLLSKSKENIKGLEISKIFSNRYLLKDNLKEIIKNIGTFFIKDKSNMHLLPYYLMFRFSGTKS